MRAFADTSWTTVTLIAVGWASGWLLLNTVALWLSLRALRRQTEGASGGLAAVGGGMTVRGRLVIFGLPLALLVFRLVLPFFRLRSDTI